LIRSPAIPKSAVDDPIRQDQQPTKSLNSLKLRDLETTTIPGASTFVRRRPTPAPRLIPARRSVETGGRLALFGQSFGFVRAEDFFSRDPEAHRNTRDPARNTPE